MVEEEDWLNSRAYFVWKVDRLIAETTSLLSKCIAAALVGSDMVADRRDESMI